MGTSGQEQRDETRVGVGTISRPAVRPAASPRVRPAVPGPAPAADPAGPRTRRRQHPETVPPPRNARPAPSADPAQRPARRLPPETVPRPGGVLPVAPAPQRDSRPAAPVPPRNARPAPSAPSARLTTAPAPPATPPGPPGPPAPSPVTLAPAAAPQARPRTAAAARSHRMPFVLMLCALLGGALVSALVISTTLAEGSFQITGLQQSTNALARQRQALEEQVAQAQSAQTIENRALALGMRPQGQLRFIDLKTGKLSSDQGNSEENAIHVPDYTP